MNSATYRNLLFDFGNVLIDIDVPGAIERLTSLFREESSRPVLEEVVLKYETGQIPTDVFINRLLDHCSPGIQARDIIEAWNSMLIGIPDYRLDMLTMLRPKYNLYLLSNTNELHITWVHAFMTHRFGIRDFEKRFFDDVYYSHVLRDRKPNASIYQHVIDDAILSPSLTLFMDDVQENLDTAKALGFGTYLVKDKEEIAEFLKLEGYY